MEVVQPRVPSLYEPYRRESGLLGARLGLPVRDSHSESPVEAGSEGDANVTPHDHPSHELRTKAASPSRREQWSAQDQADPQQVGGFDSREASALPPPYSTPHTGFRPDSVAAVRTPLRRGAASESMALPVSPPATFKPNLPEANAQADGTRFIAGPSATAAPFLVAHHLPPVTSAVRPPLAPRPGRAKSPEALPLSSPTQPTVQVSIGRVEVRAIFPERSVRRAPTPRSRPTVSLDDYLHQRGKR